LVIHKQAPAQQKVHTAPLLDNSSRTPLLLEQKADIFRSLLGRSTNRPSCISLRMRQKPWKPNRHMISHQRQGSDMTLCNSVHSGHPNNQLRYSPTVHRASPMQELATTTGQKFDATS